MPKQLTAADVARLLVLAGEVRAEIPQGMAEIAMRNRMQYIGDIAAKIVAKKPNAEQLLRLADIMDNYAGTNVITKNENIVIRLSAYDKQKLDKRAADAGKTLSDYCRAILLK